MSSRPALGYTQPPIQWVKRPRREADHSPPSRSEVKNGGTTSSLPHCVELKHRDNFTFANVTCMKRRNINFIINKIILLATQTEGLFCESFKHICFYFTDAISCILARTGRRTMAVASLHIDWHKYMLSHCWDKPSRMKGRRAATLMTKPHEGNFSPL
jgi:hypothetical protein